MTTAQSGTAPGDYRAGLVDALRTIEQLRERINEMGSGARPLTEPIAVVGLGCRLPGGSRDPESFWRMLSEGVDATGEFPAERGDARALYDPDPDAPGKAYTIRGGFLGRVDRFEPAVFGISPREALGMDPQQRLALEVAWEALEHAGYAPDSLDGSATGVYLGVSTTDYVRLRQARGAVEDVDAYQLMGEPSFAAGRISYTLGLRGPSKVIDTTCSSSLVAVHEACQALRLRECDMALAGGVNLMLAPYGFVLMSKFRALSPDGRCKTFDAAADGYARGEGAGIVTLKRLSDALRDGDHIAAVIRGSAVGHDGRSSGLTVPNPAAQQQVITGALAQAGIDPADVDYLEAHGTGTSLGDPIELRAAQAALARHRTDGEPLLVGSVKTNIGHLESAAGIAGLIKLILCLQNSLIPPHLHFDTPNPHVDWSRLQIRVTAEQHAWPDRGRDRIGAISSFGASGTNAHAVVGSAPPATEDAGRVATHRPYGLLLASAPTPEALRETAERYARVLRRSPDSTLADVCWTTQVGRARQQYGLAAVGDSLDSLAGALESYVRGEEGAALATAELPAHKHRKVAWLFTGQGAQYPGMGRDLLGEPAFREAFEECERLITPLLGRSLRGVLWPEAGSGQAGQQLDDTRFTQPALFALEYALARMWSSWGHRPGALLGHSVGEIVAACVAGVFGLADACRLVVARAALMAGLPDGGAMAAVHCSEAVARAALAGRQDRLAVAAVNGPEETVLSGDAEELARVLESLAAQGVRTRRLPVSHAFHSPLLEPMLHEFREAAEQITYAAPAVPLISDVTGLPWGPREVGADYWVRHAASAVRFHDGLSHLHGAGYRTFLEIGPAPVLAGIGERALQDGDCAWIPSLRPPARGGGPATDDRVCVRGALGLLRLRGAEPDWAAVHSGEELRRVPLPTTVWRGESYWFSEERTAQTGLPAPGRDVPWVGRRLRNAVPTYELDLDGDRWTPFARTDEDGFRYIPLGSLVDVTVAAVADALGGYWACVEVMDLLERLPLAREPRTVQITVTPADDGRAVFEYRSLSQTEDEAGASWRLHVRGTLRRRPVPSAAPPGQAADPVVGLRASRYTDRVDYEPAVLSEALVGAVTGAHRGGGDDGVLVALDPGRRAGSGTGWVELMDASVAALSWDAGRDHTGAAVAGSASHVGVLICADPGLVRYVRATAGPRTGVDGPPIDEVAGAVEFFAEDGGHIGGIDELRVVPASAAGSPPAPWRRPEDLLTRVEWQPAPTPRPFPSLEGESWLLLPDRGQVAAALAGALRARGAQCLVAATGETGPAAASLGPLLARWRAGAPETAALRVVVCTALDAPLPEDADADLMAEYRDRTELTTVSLVQQLLAGGRPGERVPVSLVTRGTQPAGDGPGRVDPFGAGVWGLGRVLALEHPEHWGGAVDLDPDPGAPGPGGGPAAEARRLLAALTDTSEDQQALRGEDRYVARLVPHPPIPGGQRTWPPVRPDAAYLVTGAFGGIGQVLCRWLAAAGVGQLVLLGRTPLPDRAGWEAPGLSVETRSRVRLVRDLEAMGVQVETVAADVADAAAMTRVLGAVSAAGRPLRGVVHAAGTSVPQFLRDIPVGDPRDYDAVWRPKVIGGWLLHQLTDGLELDFFVNFSSIASTWGSQHLSSYSAANAFLDALAEHRHSRGLPALTVSWGPWDLQSNLFDDQVLAFLTATGLRPLSAPQCLRLLGALLAGDAPQAVVCAADWSVYKPVMEARAERPLLRTVELPEDEGQPAAGPVLDALAAEDGRAARGALLVPYLQHALGEVLGVPADSLAPESDVMANGLDSLMVMEVVKRCKRDLRVSLRPTQLFERATLEDWAFLLADATAGSRSPGGGPQDPVVVQPALTRWADPARIAADVTLDPAIRPGAPPAGSPTAPRAVLLTGATGFLGAYLLDELLSGTEATVYCLVRCADPERGLARIRANSERYLPWRAGEEHRIAVLPGDLAEPLLGLGAARFEELAGSLDAIYHNGALVNFSYTYEQSRPANLAGTEEVLRLACRGPLTPVSHVSTYGIWGLPGDGRRVITEDDRIESAGKLVTGYVQSKWAAERLVELARERGVPVDVHRPGRVLGDSRTGACLTTHFTTRVIKGCVQLGMAPDLDIEIEMTPVDYVTRSLVRISREEHRFGATYHLVNRHKMRFRDLVAAMTARGWKVRTVSTDAWWQALRDGFAEQENELHAVMDVVEEFVVGGEEAIEYDASHAERALRASGITCPPLDQALLDTYFAWMIRSGYLPDPGR